MNKKTKKILSIILILSLIFISISFVFSIIIKNKNYSSGTNVGCQRGLSVFNYEDEINSDDNVLSYSLITIPSNYSLKSGDTLLGKNGGRAIVQSINNENVNVLFLQYSFNITYYKHNIQLLASDNSISMSFDLYLKTQTSLDNEKLSSLNLKQNILFVDYLGSNGGGIITEINDFIKCTQFDGQTKSLSLSSFYNLTDSVSVVLI